MKIMRLIVVATAALALAACSGGSSAPNTVHLTSADVANPGAAPAAAVMVNGITVIDAGVVSRGTIIEASLAAQNDTASQWQGYWGMTFDAGCNGADTWEIMPVQQTPLIDIGASDGTTVGGSCGDMPLGARTLTATLYDVDATTVLDQVVVTFELTN